MDKRNEYRVKPSVTDENGWLAEFRAPRIWFGRQFGWHEWEAFAFCGSVDAGEAVCRRHTGEGTKYLGRLP